MRRALLVLVFSSGPLFLNPPAAHACSCLPSGPPCEAMWNAALVFTGKVVEIVPLESATAGLPVELRPRRIRFVVSEAFRGADTAEVELHSRGGGSGMCDFPFQLGAEYLVYAHHRGDAAGWSTSTCSRTRRLHEAAEDLAYLRLPNANKGSSRIVGHVRHRWLDAASQRFVERVVPTVLVRVTDGKKVIEGRTDSNGMFVIPVAPLHSYEVTFGPVEGLLVESTAWRPVWIPDYRACGGVDGIARYDGRVSGVLVDSRGHPVSSFKVGLRTSPRIPYGPGFDQDVVTDGQGRFDFRGVQPATYEVVAGSALGARRESVAVLTRTPITVGPSERVTVGRLRLAPPR